MKALIIVNLISTTCPFDKKDEDTAMQHVVFIFFAMLIFCHFGVAFVRPFGKFFVAVLRLSFGDFMSLFPFVAFLLVYLVIPFAAFLSNFTYHSRLIFDAVLEVVFRFVHKTTKATKIRLKHIVT